MVNVFEGITLSIGSCEEIVIDLMGADGFGEEQDSTLLLEGHQRCRKRARTRGISEVMHSPMHAFVQENSTSLVGCTIFP